MFASRTIRASRRCLSVKAALETKLKADEFANVRELGRILADAKAHGRMVKDVDSALLPKSVAEAERAQISFLASAVTEHHLELVGWKLGATNPVARAKFGDSLTRPFLGSVFEQDIRHPGDVTVDFDSFRVRGVECEWVVELEESLKPRDTPWTEEEVREAVRCVYPAIEIVGTRFEEGPPSPICIIADQGGMGLLVVNKEKALSLSGWEEKGGLDGVVEARVGTEASTGTGRDVLGHPITALTWAANALNGVGLFLSAGNLVSTGTMTGITPLERGQTFTATFGSIATMRLKL